jgi:hypothetical protein
VAHEELVHLGRVVPLHRRNPSSPARFSFPASPDGSSCCWLVRLLRFPFPLPFWSGSGLGKRRLRSVQLGSVGGVGEWSIASVQNRVRRGFDPGRPGGLLCALWVGLVGMDRRGCLGQRPSLTGTRHVTTERSALVGVKSRSRATTGQPSKANGTSVRSWTRRNGSHVVVAVWEKPLLVRCGEKVTIHWHNGRWARRGSRSIPSPFPDSFLRSHALEGHRRSASLPVRHAWNRLASTRVGRATAIGSSKSTRRVPNFRRNIYSAGTMLLTPPIRSRIEFRSASVVWPKPGFEGLS